MFKTEKFSNFKISLNIFTYQAKYIKLSDEQVLEFSAITNGNAMRNISKKKRLKE
jgi:hypothetical protein